MALVGLTNRRRIPYSDIVRAEAPLARKAYYNRLAREQERKNLNAQRALSEKELSQSAKQFEDTLAANKEQFETGLAESQRQFGLSTALQKQQAEEQAKQAQLATGISTAGLGIEAYPYIKEGVSGLGNLLFTESAAPTITSTGAGAGVGLGGATDIGVGAGLGSNAPVGAGFGGGTSIGSEAGGGLGGAGIAGIIAAAIIGQHAAANATDTVYKGQKTGDFFTFDEQGRWAPRFGNEPWHGYLNSQWGIGPSAGEKFDAAMYNQDWGELARVTPSTVQQWLNPVGDFGYDVIENKWGPNVAGTLDPVTYGFDRLAGAKDIGEAGKALVDTSAKVIDPVGTLVGPTAKDFVSDVTGSTALGEAANVLLNPIGAAADVIDNWSYLCTETHKIVGLAKNDHLHLKLLNEFSKDHPLAKHYFKNAPKLIKKISEIEKDLQAFYSKFYTETIAPVIQLIKHGKMDEARNHYATDYLNLLEIYTPELMPKSSEVKNA